MIEIIPAVDIIEGRCVRLTQGDFGRSKIYHENPLDAARMFEDAGLRRLHVVDLDGAKRGKVANLRTLETLAANTDLAIDFGGGIKTGADLAAVFDAGAQFAAIGSVAVKDPDLFFAWLDEYGGERLLLGADVRGRRLAIDGWQTATELEVIPFLKNYAARGVTQVFVTDIARDGLLAGPSAALYAEIRRELPEIELIASGGVSTLEDVRDLEKIGCAGVIVGKAIYEGRIKLKRVKG